jgi:hypothetical protein
LATQSSCQIPAIIGQRPYWHLAVSVLADDEGVHAARVDAEV